LTQQPPSSSVVSPAQSSGATAAEREKKPKKDKSSQTGAESGVETMFRVTYQNHVALSQLADNKANTLISINGLIISILLAGLTPRLVAMSWLLAPALALIAGCAPSLVFAVLASRPRLNRRPVTVEQVRNNGGNILFFGQFSGMPLNDFSDSMHALMSDPQLLHDNLIRQLYFMGEALEQKYRRLQVAYAAFLFGIGGASALFAVFLIAKL
jgi:Pycsar effector protein